MLRLYLSCLVLALTLLGSGHAEAQNSEKDAIKHAERMGRLIYDHDQAAWHATDAFLADIKENGQPVGLKGWITIPDGRNITVKFVAQKDAQLVSVWQASVRSSKVRKWERLTTTVPLTADETVLFQARLTPPIRDQELCGQFLPLNTVVFPIPDDPGGRIYSYFLASTKQASEVVIGRHFRFTLSADGQTVLETRQFNNSCLALNNDEVPSDAKTEAMFVIHIQSDTPEEHHVFAQLTSGIALFVGAGDEVFEVKNGKIRKVKQ